jgi:hypothetical protein
VIGERFTTSARAEKPDLPPLRSWILSGALLGLAGVVVLAALLVTDTAAVSILWQGEPDSCCSLRPSVWRWPRDWLPCEVGPFGRGRWWWP